MEKLPKLNQIFSGILIVITGILFSIFVLVAVLLPKSFIIESPLTWFLVAIFLIIYIEIGIWWTKQGFAIATSKLEYKEKSIWSLIAEFYRYADIVHVTIFIVFVLAFFGFILYSLIPRLVYEGIVLSNQFFILAATFVIYAIARKPIGKVFTPIMSKFRRVLPSYSLMDNSVIINLKWRKLWGPKKDYVVKIDFNEIDEIRVFSWVEATAFLKYTIGPNIELLVRQTKDLHRYAKGEIARPSVYIVQFVSIGNTVLLKGPNLFYFITFDKDPSDLVNAYNLFKKDKDMNP